jgi:hypothetical protein
MTDDEVVGSSNGPMLNGSIEIESEKVANVVKD